jgi:hypothetical protein
MRPSRIMRQLTIPPRVESITLKKFVVTYTTTQGDAITYDMGASVEPGGPRGKPAYLTGSAGWEGNTLYPLHTVDTP